MTENCIKVNSVKRFNANQNEWVAIYGDCSILEIILVDMEDSFPYYEKFCIFFNYFS